jgi:hypothetical protein
MSELVIYKDETGRLAGFGERGRRAWDKFRKIVGELEIGETMGFSYHLPRSPQHHKFVFARFQALLERQETFEDLEHLIIFLKVGASFVEFIPGPGGQLVAIPQSIAWDRLDEQAFIEVKRKIWDFIWTPVCQAALWPNLDDHQRYAMVDGWVREVER